MSDTHDAIIVGAGFAGLTAARELKFAGLEPLVLEARDRIGGRAWTAERMGREIEMGGFDVHWLQAQTWTEVSRYGLDIQGFPEPQWISWHAEGQRHVGSLEELDALLRAGGTPLAMEALEVFERPHEPFYNEAAVTERDGKSVFDRLQELGLSQAELDVNDTFWSVCFQAPSREGGLTQALRWLALSGWDIGLCLDICSRYKLGGGINRLTDAMAKSAQARIELGKPVASIEQDSEQVTVTTRDGEVFTGRAAIVTVPINALSGIDFRPGLSAAKNAAAEEGQASRGFKVVAHVTKMDPFFAIATPEHPLIFSEYEEVLDDGTGLVVAFGLDSNILDVEDRDAVERALREMAPDIEVIETTCHDWVADEFARETWPMLKPNQLTSYLRDLQRPEGRVLLAGSDYASGWAGFISGAIESGMTAATSVKGILSGTIETVGAA